MTPWGAFVLGPLLLSPAVAASADAAVSLGEALFFDRSLSGDGRTACATCHRSDAALADDKQVSEGAFSRRGTRNAPSIFDLAHARSYFWDGRRSTLQDMVLDPLLHPSEHALPDERAVVDIVRLQHAELHRCAFGEVDISATTVKTALVAYLMTLVSTPSRFDQYAEGNRQALSEAERRGFDLFTGEAACATCHCLGTFDDGKYHQGDITAEMLALLGEAALVAARLPEQTRYELIPVRQDLAALGRYNVTLRADDIGKFRTPSLRNVGLTPPYMHDGSVPSLSEAIEHEIYWRSVGDISLERLSPSQRQDIVAFLQTLSSLSLLEGDATRDTPASPSAPASSLRRSP